MNSEKLCKPFNILKGAFYLASALSLLVAMVLLLLSALAIDRFDAVDVPHCIKGIVFGSASFAILYLGFYSVQIKNSLVLCLYFILLNFSLLLQILSLHGFREDDYHVFITDWLNNIWDKELNETNISISMQHLEHLLQCCGLRSWHDYKFANRTIPVSCYADSSINNFETLYKDGCQNKVINNFAHHAELIRTTSIVLVEFESAVLILVCLLIYEIGRIYEKRNCPVVDASQEESDELFEI